MVFTIIDKINITSQYHIIKVVIMIGKIYRIIHLDSDVCYVGSTSKSVEFRWSNHITSYDRWLNGGVCVGIYPLFQLYGIERFKVIVEKEYDVCDRNQLRAYEQLWINRFKKTAVNKNAAFNLNILIRNRYYKANKEMCLAKVKQWQEANKDKMKQYREANKDKVKQWKEANKDKIAKQSKQFREANKEKLAKQSKQYYEANKDKIAKKNKQYHEANKDKNKQYREANKDKIKQTQDIYRARIRLENSATNEAKRKAKKEASKERACERQKQYQEANKEKMKQYQAIYRAKIKVEKERAKLNLE